MISGSTVIRFGGAASLGLGTREENRATCKRVASKESATLKTRYTPPARQPVPQYLFPFTSFLAKSSEGAFYQLHQSIRRPAGRKFCDELKHAADLGVCDWRGRGLTSTDWCDGGELGRALGLG